MYPDYVETYPPGSILVNRWNHAKVIVCIGGYVPYATGRFMPDDGNNHYYLSNVFFERVDLEDEYEPEDYSLDIWREYGFTDISEENSGQDS